MIAMKQAFTLAPILMALSSPAIAQETRSADPGFEPAPATLEEFDWLIGKWEGPGFKGGRSILEWRAAIGNVMVGSEVVSLVTTDGYEAFHSSESSLLIEAVGTVFMRSATADIGAEAEIQESWLIAIEPCAAFFENLTIRCSDPKAPGSGLLVAFRYGTDGPQDEIIRLYQNADGE